jgi:excisionase family DNA binding protein
MRNPTVPTSPSPIDLLTPAQACRQLCISEDGLVELVNSGRLPAFNIAGHIRFRVTDVSARTASLALAG